MTNETILAQIAFALHRTEQKEIFLQEFDNKYVFLSQRELDKYINIIYQGLTYDFSLRSNSELDNIIRILLFDMDINDLIDIYDLLQEEEVLCK